ncbi:MAG: glutamine synthetase family protein [Acidimicrobiales bacterium]
MTVGEALDRVADQELHSVRVVFTDQHGHLRGKTMAASVMASAFERGIGVPASLLHKDTGNTYAVRVWEPTGDATLDGLVGAPNIVMRPDPATLRVLPWVDGTGIVLADLTTTDGRPIPHSTRGLCRRAVDELGARGLGYMAGLELELHLFRVAGDGALEHTHPGWDLLGEDALDRIEPAVEPIRRGLTALGFTPMTIEAELGPSQIELTFAPTTGLAVADQAVLVRSAIRHLARRNGHRATFMSRPRLDDDAFPSGWHLHQSLVDAADGGNLFRPGPGDELLSPLGRNFVAGLLANAPASCLLTTPTVTGYKRYRPHAVTPDRITWSREHRGAMLRVIGGPDDPATRVENRAGDPAANPYLYVASQIWSGLDGIECGRQPPPPALDPYDVGSGDRLPRSLGEALMAFETSDLYRRVLGADVAAYLATLKRSEWRRFCSAVTDWEQREYFPQF